MTDNNAAYTHLKQLLVNRLKEIFADKIVMTKAEIASATDSRNNETKSSVGDKYETGRAMVQYELEKAQVQLEKNIQIEQELIKIDIHKSHNKAGLGSLIVTSEGNYFIAIGIGKVEIENENIFCISLNSPIGKELQHKREGDKLLLQGKEIYIFAIV